MRTSFPIIIALFLAFAGQVVAQDVLLMTNGKYRKLKGKVVYTDHKFVLWQTAKQESGLKRFEAVKAARQASPSYVKEMEQKAIRKHREDSLKLVKGQVKLEKRRKEFESAIKVKIETLSPGDFEQWKIRELDRLKKAETDRNLKIAMAEKLASMKQQRKEALDRGRFANAVSRERVFSIIHPDSTETVVYSADTLGFLAEGDAEVEYGVAEMRMYIKGRQDGRKHGIHDIGIGAGVGLAAGLLNTWFLDVFYAPITPAVCIAVMSAITPRPSPKMGLTANELQSEAYMDGYERSAKGRKITMFTLGAAGGLGIGIAAGIVTSPLLR